MAILKVAEVGNPGLRQRAREVEAAELESSWLTDLVRDLVDTMRDYDGVGIAAPQVHAPVRVFAIEVRNTDRYRDATPFPLTLVVNPTLEILDPARSAGIEGCLSVPELRASVDRAHGVRVRGYHPDGEPLDLDLHGFPAIVAQHETDHLDGVLYLDRADLATLTTVGELARARARDAHA